MSDMDARSKGQRSPHERITQIVKQINESRDLEPVYDRTRFVKIRMAGADLKALAREYIGNAIVTAHIGEQIELIVDNEERRYAMRIFQDALRR